MKTVSDFRLVTGFVSWALSSSCSLSNTFCKAVRLNDEGRTAANTFSTSRESVEVLGYVVCHRGYSPDLCVAWAEFL